MECRALCEGPQRFEEYEYLGYKAGLYEAIAGKDYFFFDFLIVEKTRCQTVPTM